MIVYGGDNNIDLGLLDILIKVVFDIVCEGFGGLVIGLDIIYQGNGYFFIWLDWCFDVQIFIVLD